MNKKRLVLVLWFMLATTLAYAGVPVVTLQPTSVSVCGGQPANFTADATATPSLKTVQWQLSTNGGSTYANINGATGKLYSTGVATVGMNGYKYQVVFTNQPGSTTSSAATLTVNASTSISANPVSQTVVAPATATFSITASGSPTYQWQLSTNGGSTWVNITGETSASYTTPASTAGMNGYQYRVIVTTGCGTQTSTAAILTVTSTVAAPVITGNPTSATVCAFNPVSFTASASGTPTPTVQWQRSTTAGGGTYADVTGATSATYTFTPLAADTGFTFKAVFTNDSGSATSSASTLTVRTLPVITAQPVSATVSAGGTASFISTANGVPSPAVQWQTDNGSSGATWVNITGATSTTYSFTTSAGQNGYKYRAVFSNACGSVNSTVATLTTTGHTAVLAWVRGVTVPVADSVIYSVYKAQSTCPAPGYARIVTGLTSTGYTDAALTSGATYCYTVTETDTAAGNGIESAKSASVQAVIPASVGNKFLIGDRVDVIPDGPANPGGNITVRATPATSGVLLGIQGPGAAGTVVGGPVLDTSDQTTRYNINFDTGVDGWAIELYLEKIP
jgi:hypothetical protein